MVLSVPRRIIRRRQSVRPRRRADRYLRRTIRASAPMSRLRARAHTKIGAGIAADPLSPHFDPLDVSAPKGFRIRAVWFRRPLHLAPQAATRLCVSVTGPGAFLLRGSPPRPRRPAQRSETEIPVRIASATIRPTAFTPRGDAHPAILGQHAFCVAGTRKECLGLSFRTAPTAPAFAPLVQAAFDRQPTVKNRRTPCDTFHLSRCKHLMFRQFPASVPSRLQS